MAAAVKVRSWGNSMGVVLPLDIIEQEQIKEGDTIFVEVVKKADLRSVFGSLQQKLSGQKFKDLVRQGWKS